MSAPLDRTKLPEQIDNNGKAPLERVYAPYWREEKMSKKKTVEELSDEEFAQELFVLLGGESYEGYIDCVPLARQIMETNNIRTIPDLITECKGICAEMFT
jgi:hypothetical protein